MSFQIRLCIVLGNVTLISVATAREKICKLDGKNLATKEPRDVFQLFFREQKDETQSER